MSILDTIVHIICDVEYDEKKYTPIYFIVVFLNQIHRNIVDYIPYIQIYNYIHNMPDSFENIKKINIDCRNPQKGYITLADFYYNDYRFFTFPYDTENTHIIKDKSIEDNTIIEKSGTNIIVIPNYDGTDFKSLYRPIKLYNPNNVYVCFHTIIADEILYLYPSAKVYINMSI